MSLLMSFKMLSNLKNKKLYTEKDLNFERIFEVRIIDLRMRGGVRQKSFSVLADKGLSDNDYLLAEELKDFLANKIKELNDSQK